MLTQLKSLANSWLGFIIFLLALSQGIRYWQNHSGKSAFDNTGLPQITLAQAKIMAAEQNKLIVAELSAYWCGTCVEMDRKLFSQSNVKQVLQQQFIYSRIDSTSDEAEAFMQTYGAQGYPTLVLLNSAGEHLKTLPLTFDAHEFLASLQIP